MNLMEITSFKVYYIIMNIICAGFECIFGLHDHSGCIDGRRGECHQNSNAECDSLRDGASQCESHWFYVWYICPMPAGVMYDEPFADNWSNEVEKDVCGRI